MSIKNLTVKCIPSNESKQKSPQTDAFHILPPESKLPRRRRYPAVCDFTFSTICRTPLSPLTDKRGDIRVVAGSLQLVCFPVMNRRSCGGSCANNVLAKLFGHPSAINLPGGTMQFVPRATWTAELDRLRR